MNELKEWYEGIDQNTIAPNGAIKIKVPVLDADNDNKPVVVTGGESNHPTANGGSEENKDPVVVKDKNSSLKAFVYAKKIQDLLVKAAGLDGPYDEDSEIRQALVDKIKLLYRKMGEEITCL